MNNERQAKTTRPDQVEVLSRSARPPDLVLRYGDDADHVADVHLPRHGAGDGTGSSGGLPFTLFMHGGFWRAEYGREHTRPLAEALAAAGFVVCAPEYRRSGQPGGGWPGTFDDVAAAVDRLPGLVAERTGGLIDPDRMVLGGHSAGGHLALWAASRHRLRPGSPWRASGPPAAGVVPLAAVSELASAHALALGRQAAGALMGGGPEELAEEYSTADPSALVPTGAAVRLVHGTADDRVPYEMSLSYARRARMAGDEATCVLLPGVGHFDLIDPLSGAWDAVVSAFRHAVGWAPGTGEARAGG